MQKRDIKITARPDGDVVWVNAGFDLILVDN